MLTERLAMSDNLRKLAGYRARRVDASPNHRFPVGALVSFNGGLFKVTRHLPDGGAGLQYRLKNERDGQERVAVESSLDRDRR